MLWPTIRALLPHSLTIALVLALGVMQFRLDTAREQQMNRLENQNANLSAMLQKQNEYLTAYDDVLEDVAKYPDDSPVSPAVDRAADGLQRLDEKRTR